MQLDNDEEAIELVRERELWLASFSLKEGDVMTDRENHQEYILLDSEDEDCSVHYTKVFIPYTLQSSSIANFY